MDSLKRIFSPASASGPMPCGELAGPMPDLSGQDLVPVNHSALLVVEQGLPTSATSGPSGSGSSASACLQRSLVNKLEAELAGNGSTLYSLTWNEQTTPSGRSISQLVASVPRTSDNAPTSSRAGWATPAAREAGGTPEQFLERKRRARARGAKLGVSLTSLALQAQLVVSGQTQTGSDAPMGNQGQLNPAHPRWLQGLPPEWDEAAPTESRATETRSARKPR